MNTSKSTFLTIHNYTHMILISLIYVFEKYEKLHLKSHKKKKRIIVIVLCSNVYGAKKSWEVLLEPIIQRDFFLFYFYF